MLGKLLVFDRMYENSTFIFCFFKGKINLKVFKFFLFLKKKSFEFFLKYFGENRVF